MTSMEMERRSGVPRANIRYYEAEGLLTPQRAKNGYREYSEADLAALEKIKLLRRLGVSMEELKALCGGRAELDTVLDHRLAALQGEEEMLRRVERVCGALRASGETFATLDAEKYLQTLDAEQAAPTLPAADTLPAVYSISRRLFARLFDTVGLEMLFFALMALLGKNPASLSGTAIALLLGVVQLFLEPAVISLTGTTPGKALLGMRLRAPNGKKLSYGAAFTRYFGMLWHGMGLGIPIWSLIQLYRTVRRCVNGESQPWDEETAYIAAPYRWQHTAAFLGAAAAVLVGTEAVNSACQLPPNRGALTVAEFAENYNRQAEYLGLNARTYLDAEGQRQVIAQNGNVVYIGESLGWKSWDAAKNYNYTVENGRITAITMAAEAKNVTELVGVPISTAAELIPSFVWAQEDAPFWSFSRKELLQKLERADWENGFELRDSGVVLRGKVTCSGMLYQQDWAYCMPEGTGENSLVFSFSVEVEE